MLKQFSKIFFYTTLAIALAVVPFIFYQPLANPYIELLYSWSGHKEVATEYIVLTAPSIVFIGTIIALLFSTFVWLAMKKKVATAEKSNGFFTYYFIGIPLLAALSVAFTYIEINPYKYYVDSDILVGRVIATVYCFFIAGGIVLAALCIGIKTLWKQNKPIATIFAFNCLICLFSTYLTSLLYKDISTYNYDDSYLGYKYNDGGFNDDYEEPSYEVETAYFSFLWQNSSSDYTNEY